MSIRIITNNVPRDVVDAWELPAEMRKEFDYLDWNKIEAGEDSASFFKYRGTWYDLGEFMTTVNLGVQVVELKQWDGYRSDSFFSGLVVRFVENGERVVVGLYLS